MKADLGEAGQYLLIPRRQQQIIRGLKPANRRAGPTCIQNGCLTVKVTEFFEPQKMCFFRSAVNRKNALTSFLEELETSK
jgi:hypothetical protein